MSRPDPWRDRTERPRPVCTSPNASDRGVSGDTEGAMLRRPRTPPTEQQLRDRANAMLGRRALQRIGPHQYRIQGAGKDPHGQPNWWHIDLSKQPPYCDCPAFLNYPETPQRCKHTTFCEQVEHLFSMIGTP